MMNHRQVRAVIINPAPQHVSPILFMLFMQPLLTAKPTSAGSLPRRGYADDILLTARGPSPDSNALALATDLDACISWCRNNGLDIDRDKTGLIHFSRSPKHGNPSVDGGQLMRDITPVSGKQTLRWLGVYWDRRLSFVHHARIVAARGRNAANALKMLGGCYKGTPTRLLLNVARACVLPTMTFAAE